MNRTAFLGFVNDRGSVPQGELKPGDEITLQCNLSDIYLYSHGDKTYQRDAVRKLFTPSKWCGKKYVIN